MAKLSKKEEALRAAAALFGHAEEGKALGVPVAVVRNGVVYASDLPSLDPDNTPDALVVEDPAGPVRYDYAYWAATAAGDEWERVVYAAADGRKLTLWNA